ncbi:DENN domain-containing protein 4C [Bienertia sinuspersici]
MAETEASSNQGWRSSLSFPSSEDVARAVEAAANAVGSPRPSVVFSSNEDSCNSPLKRIQNQVSKALKGFSQSPETRNVTYNPEMLTKQKRQWASFQLESLDHRSFKEPSKFFESMVVVGLPPSFDTQELRKRLIARKSEGSGRFRIALSGHDHSGVEPNFEPQVLFAYPPEKQLPLKYRDLLSFCFPGGVEVHAVEKSSSMSELNEILLGQEHLKQSELSFGFRLQQGADNSTLYGCCILMEELMEKPSRLISLISDSQPVSSCLGRYIFTTKRCYCILSRLPFFEMHFGVLKSIFMEERLERVTKSISILDLEVPDAVNNVEGSEDNNGMLTKLSSEDETNETIVASPSSSSETTASTRVTDVGSHLEHSDPERVFSSFREDTEESLTTTSYERDTLAFDTESTVAKQNNEASDIDVDNSALSKPASEKAIPDAVWPLIRYQQVESSEPSCSQGSPCEERPLKNENGETDVEETSISGQEDFSSHNDILEWAKVLTLFAGALLEKQIVFVCSNLKDDYYHYSASDSERCIWETGGYMYEGLDQPMLWSIVSLRSFSHSFDTSLSVAELVDAAGFQAQKATVTVGVQSKSSEVSKLTNAILVDISKNQVKSQTIPQLPQQRDLLASLAPYHSKLVGESYLGRKRPIYECTDAQVEAANGFTEVLRNYLDSLCSNLRSHTITNVQSNDDKVSLLLKESFIDSFPSRDRPFMKVSSSSFQVNRTVNALGTDR